MKKQTDFSLSYLPMKISLISLERATLPAYLGSTLRGVIGQALHQDIEAYNYLYRNSILSSNGQDVLNPYIIVSPPMGKSTYDVGEELCFHMLLLGDATNYTEQLVTAIQEVKRRGLGAGRHPFELVKVTHSLDQRVIWKEGLFYNVATQSAMLPYRSLQDVKKVLIQTRTPLRIRRGGVLLEAVDFPTIIRNITNRIQGITTRYGGWVDEMEVKRIQALSAEVCVLSQHFVLQGMSRYSNRLDASMDFSGLMGNVAFEGDLTPFVPWLHAAQILHVGRNTTFGMGRIEVEFY